MGGVYLFRKLKLSSSFILDKVVRIDYVSNSKVTFSKSLQSYTMWTFVLYTEKFLVEGFGNKRWRMFWLIDQCAVLWLPFHTQSANKQHSREAQWDEGIY